MDILVFKRMKIFVASVIILSGTTYAEGNNTYAMVFYADDAIISCNNSAEVIQIHEIQMQSRELTCADRTEDDCVISDPILNATKQICDGLNQCQIQKSSITENITWHESLGYMTLSNACSENRVMQCNFGRNWCGFGRDPADNFCWKRRRTNLGTGYYAFIKKQNTDIDNSAQAKLSYFISHSNKHKCLKFILYMKNTFHPLFLYDSDTLLHRFNTSDLKSIGQWNTIKIDLPYNRDIDLIFQVDYSNGGRTFQGFIAIDSIRIFNNKCEDLDLRCVPIRQFSELKACSDSTQKSLFFEPQFEQCQGVNNDINVQFQEQCQPLNDSKICNFDLQSSVDRYPSCFRRYVSIEYSCQGRNDYQELFSSDEKMNSLATIFGPVVGLVLIAISVSVTIIVWRRYKTTTNHPVRKQTNENDYTGCQNVALSDNEIHQGDVSSRKNITTEKSVFSIINGESNGFSEAYCNIGCKNVKDGQSHKVDSIIKSNDLIHKKREKTFNNSGNTIPPVDSLSTSNQNESGAYIVLDKNETGFSHGYRITQEGGDYEFAKPLAESSQYSTGGEQYTVSGSNIHNEPESNLYSHCLDTTYDTAQHCLQTDDLDANYDHFIGVKSEDDYDISFR